jgi:nucleotide-binding universal stress UspA family protein
MFKTILLPVDLGEETSWTKALQAAVLHARNDGGSLHVLTVVPNFGEGIVGAYFPPDFAERALATAKSELEAFCAERVPADVAATAMVRSGRIYEEVIETAKEINADLIVMASHRPALRDYLIGPNAERIMRHAACSVLVVRE